MEIRDTNNGLLKERNTLFAVAGIGVLLAAYTFYRALILSFTHDESFCFLFYVRDSFLNIVSYKMPTANNHIVNTLGMKYFSALFGSSEIIFRLPNVLSHLMYMVFSYYLLRRLTTGHFLIAGFIILNFNPYLLEYFSLARGYGLSTGFMMGSVYYLIAYRDDRRSRQVFLSLIFTTFAIYSNFVLMHYYVSLVAVLNLLFISFYTGETDKKKGFWDYLFRKNVPVIIITLATFLVCFVPVQKLVKFNELYGRGQHGFWNDTFLTFVHGSLYDHHYFNSDIVKPVMIILVVLLSLALIFFIIELRNKRFRLYDSRGILFLILLLAPVLSTILQHHLMHSEFLVYRTTLFFFPLLGLVLFWLSGLPFLHNSSNKGLQLFVWIIPVLFVIHTTTTINFSKTFEWPYDSSTREMIHDLEGMVSQNPSGQHVKLGISWFYEPTVNFYRITRKLDWLQEVNREGPKGSYDYYYVLENDTVAAPYHTILKKYPSAQTILAK